MTIERRRYARITPKGTVLLATPGTRGRIANLSEGGVYVLTSQGASLYTAGMAVELELRADGPLAAWVVATGRIARSEPTGLAIAFATPSARMLRMVDDLRKAAHRHRRTLSVVLIDADEGRRAAMATGFRTVGCTVIEAGTPLEAIVSLGESQFEPDVIAVAEARPISGADQMRAFIERDHPAARLVTIGDEVFAPDGFVNWLSTSVDADLAQRMRDVLCRSE